MDLGPLTSETNRKRERERERHYMSGGQELSSQLGRAVWKRQGFQSDSSKGQQKEAQRCKPGSRQGGSCSEEPPRQREAARAARGKSEQRRFQSGGALEKRGQVWRCCAQSRQRCDVCDAGRRKGGLRPGRAVKRQRRPSAADVESQQRCPGTARTSQQNQDAQACRVKK